ncbi:MAG: flagellar hook-length control protein FliK [Spirochaetota bacterium]
MIELSSIDLSASKIERGQVKESWSDNNGPDSSDFAMVLEEIIARISNTEEGSGKQKQSGTISLVNALGEGGISGKQLKQILAILQEKLGLQKDGQPGAKTGALLRKSLLGMDIKELLNHLEGPKGAGVFKNAGREGLSKAGALMEGLKKKENNKHEQTASFSGKKPRLQKLERKLGYLRTRGSIFDLSADQVKIKTGAEKTLNVDRQFLAKLKALLKQKLQHLSTEKGGGAAEKQASGKSAAVRMAEGRKGFVVHLNSGEVFAEKSSEQANKPLFAGNDRHADRSMIFAASRYEGNLQQAFKTELEMPRSSQELFNQIVKQFNLVIKKGGGEARFVLKPESLGHIKLNVQLNNSQVTTSMIVENQAIKELIVAKQALLEQALAQQGMNMTSFQVEVKQRNQEGSMDTRSGKSRQAPSTRNRSSAGVQEAPLTVGLPWISTVINVTA